MFVTQSIMKTPLFALICGLALAGGGLTRAMAYGPNDATARTTVMFFEPEKFTDASDQWNSDLGRPENLADLKTYLVRTASRYLAPGQKLSITITDVDLAGDFEPWRSSQLSDVRMVRDIYPPRIDLMFRLTDADGQIVKEGKRELRDPNFMMKLTMDRNDPLRHEKNLLDSWLGEEFRSTR